MDRAPTDPPASAYPRLLGGRLCLDFANSVDPRLAVPAWDPLAAYADLVGWGRYAGALDAAAAERLPTAAAHRPDEAAAVFAAAIALREALYRLFTAVAVDETPARADLDRLAASYRSALAVAQLGPAAIGPSGDPAGGALRAARLGDPSGRGPTAVSGPSRVAGDEPGEPYGWLWPNPADQPTPDLAAPLWPIATSAVETLTEGDPRRLKRCHGTGRCGWLFYDASKNGSRRWCSMEGCGGQVKSRRHAAKQRG